MIHEIGGKAYLAHTSSYFAKLGSKEEIQEAYKNTIKFARDFITKLSPKKNIICIDGVEVYHPSYLENIEVVSEIEELVKKYRLASSGGTDIHVDKTLGTDEKISSDSMGRSVVRSKIRKFKYLRKKAVSIMKLRNFVTANKDTEIKIEY